VAALFGLFAQDDAGAGSRDVIFGNKAMNAYPVFAHRYIKSGMRE
jgi:hypothetical protein